MTIHIDEPPASVAPRPRRPGRTPLVVVAGLVVLALAVWLFGPSGSAEPAKPAPTPRASDKSEPLPDGLDRGTATATFEDATRRVSGVPRGFPQTTDGAVEAYVSSLGTFVMGMATMSDAELDTFTRDFMTGTLDYGPLAADKKALIGLDQDGRLQGGEAGDKLYSSCPPELGAYRSQVKSTSEVVVTYWGPCIYGAGSETNREKLNVVWQSTSGTMRFVDGDWRLVPGTPGAASPTGAKAPAPANVNRPDTSYAERAQLLGAGWQLFDGASQGWPTQLLGQRP